MKHQPFSDDITYLEHELAWVEARCRLVAAIRDHEADEHQHAHRTRTCCRPQNSTETEVPEDLAALHQYERDVRHEIDARVAATEAAGRTLGLRVVVRELELDEVDRNTLLLALVPCVGARATDSLERIGAYALSGSIAAEAVAVFCRLGFGDRLRRLRFDSRHKLVQAGLVTTDVYDDAPPGDWPNASITLTNKGLAALTGLGPVSTAESAP